MNKDYGEEASLVEILESLAYYCASNSTKKVKIKIVLPKEILHQFIATFTPTERIVSPEAKEKLPSNTIRTLYVTGGEIELLEDEIPTKTVTEEDK